MSSTAQQNDFKTPLLAAGFTGDLYALGDAEYTSAISRFAKNAQKNAGVVAFVKSSEDVSKVLKSVNTRGGTPPEVVIRGGGHNTSGSSSSEGGIVIDLSRYLNTVRVDAEKKLAYVGGGATWRAVDAETVKHGLATTGGTASTVGVGGLSLGGGIGWLMGEHGMVIDNIVQATVVTADGSILTANSTSNPDLYWGIRGGGCNFGCITEFVLQLHPQRATVFAGVLVFPPPLVSKVVSALQEWYSTASEKEAAQLVMTSKTPMNTPAVVVFVFYNGDEEEGRKRFAKLIALGPVVDRTGMMPYEALNTISDEDFTYGDNFEVTGTLRGTNGDNPGSMTKIFNKVLEIASAPGECTKIAAPGITIIQDLFNLKKHTSVPADGTAFRMRTTSTTIIIIVSWKGDGVEAREDAKARLASVRSFFDEESKETFSGGLGENDTGYGNYEMGIPQDMDAAKVLYGGNYQRLQILKGKYDPGLLFKSWFPIQPVSTGN